MRIEQTIAARGFHGALRIEIPFFGSWMHRKRPAGRPPLRPPSPVSPTLSSPLPWSPHRSPSIVMVSPKEPSQSAGEEPRSHGSSPHIAQPTSELEAARHGVTPGRQHRAAAAARPERARHERLRTPSLVGEMSRARRARRSRKQRRPATGSRATGASRAGRARRARRDRRGRGGPGEEGSPTLRSSQTRNERDDPPSAGGGPHAVGRSGQAGGAAWRRARSAAAFGGIPFSGNPHPPPSYAGRRARSAAFGGTPFSGSAASRCRRRGGEDGSTKSRRPDEPAHTLRRAGALCGPARRARGRGRGRGPGEEEPLDAGRARRPSAAGLAPRRGRAGRGTAARRARARARGGGAAWPPPARGSRPPRPRGALETRSSRSYALCLR